MPQYHVTISVRDAKDKIKALTAYGTFADDAAATVRAQALAASVDNLSLGVLAKVELTKTISTNSTTPTGNVDKEVLGVFTFRHAQGFNTQLSVPAFDEASYVPSNTDVIDQASAEVTDFQDEIVNGGWTDYRGSDITQWISAIKDYGG